MPMKKTMMYLEEEMHAYLAQEASRRGISMAEIAREAIAQYRTQSAERPTPGIAAVIGLIDTPGPPTNDAERVDELLGEYYGPGGAWDREHGLVGDS